MAKQRVDFTELHNPTLKWLLDDGTEILVKVVMFDIQRLDEKLPDGQQKHEFKVQVITEQLAPQGVFDITKLKKDV